jgi:hypothetical protein
LWLEQLVAESTGKDGRGVLPVRVTGTSDPISRSSLARDIFAHHVMVAGLAWSLDVDPFNQPDVEIAKLNVFPELERGYVFEATESVAADTMATIDNADYVALHVFGPHSVTDEIEALRGELATSWPTVSGSLAPRFLHSTGQLFRVVPKGLVALQVTLEATSESRRIPGRHYSFHDLYTAQARADAAAMRTRGQTVIELHAASLAHVADLLSQRR